MNCVHDALNCDCIDGRLDPASPRYPLTAAAALARHERDLQGEAPVAKDRPIDQAKRAAVGGLGQIPSINEYSRVYQPNQAVRTFPERAYGVEKVAGRAESPVTGDSAVAKVSRRIAELNAIRERYLAYQQDRVNERDHHGAWDVAVNLSETECEISGLNFALEAMTGVRP